MFGLINVPIARLSKEQSQTSELYDEVLYGTFIEIKDEFKDYYRIKTFYNYQGLVKKTDIKTINKDFDFFNTFNGIIVSHYIDVLAEPKYQSYPLISLPRGSYVKIIDKECKEGWQAVELVDGNIGYIRSFTFKLRKKYNLISDKELIRKNIVNNALSYMNAQYRWGGKTILGIDCSGLCSISYLLEEIVIYRDAKLNKDIINTYKMREITRDELKPGDLLYSPGHIMMYIGKNEFIHSSGSLSGVRINSLNPDDDNYEAKYEQKLTGFTSIL